MAQLLSASPPPVNTNFKSLRPGTRATFQNIHFPVLFWTALMREDIYCITNDPLPAALAGQLGTHNESIAIDSATQLE